MQKMARLLLVTALFLSVCACSIQVSGMQNTYESPNRALSDVAVLKVTSGAASLISIDGKSINDNSTTLEPGIHKIVLYVGKNNYTSSVNHMVVLSAHFKAGMNYIIRANGREAWIEDALGRKVSVIVSKMDMNKSATL